MSKPPRSTSLFEDQSLLLIGQVAEAIVIEFLKSLSHVVPPIDDLRDIEEWQKKEVDFRVTLKSGEVKLIEVKSDKHIGKSGRALFEVCRIHHVTDNPKHAVYPGWSTFSESDTIFVWCPTTLELFVFFTSDLRRAVQGYTQEARKSTRIDYVYSDSTRSTINILVPLTYLSYRIYRKNGEKWEQTLRHKAERGLHAERQAA